MKVKKLQFFTSFPQVSSGKKQPKVWTEQVVVAKAVWICLFLRLSWRLCQDTLSSNDTIFSWTDTTKIMQLSMFWLLVKHIYYWSYRTGVS